LWNRHNKSNRTPKLKKSKKRANFTYYGAKVRTITNLFKDADNKIAYKQQTQYNKEPKHETPTGHMT
jgi:hypothetical protein